MEIKKEESNETKLSLCMLYVHGIAQYFVQDLE